MVKKSETGFDKLARLIKRESEDIREHMATKQDIVMLAMKDDEIIEEVRAIKERLKEIESIVEDHAGHSKEIDHALERIAAIEKHLGIKIKL